MSFFLLSSTISFAQHDEQATVENFKGIQYLGDDSTFYINFRFRMQNRAMYTLTKGEIQNTERVEARIRRLRLRMDGFIYNSKLTYSIQLGFTRGDQDYDDTDIVNIVRDAVVFYNFTDKFYISFGQSKLPGNRQRVNSSGELQFAERSLVNANFNIDRDFGLKAYYSPKIGGVPMKLKFAVSTGEGRVSTSTDMGLAYTGRAEVLPLGEFKGKGDYIEGDLAYEQSLKLSLGGGYSYNDRTTRAGGQTGIYLSTPVTLKTQFFDFIAKFRGWAYQFEYMERNATNPIRQDLNGQTANVYVGHGLNQQLSYILNKKSGYEVAGRYTRLSPRNDIRQYEKKTEVVELGLTRYFRAHRLKLQLNANYQFNDGKFKTNAPGNIFGGIFQIELGI
ncbi:porin [Pedobacter suwonensis]